MVFPFLDVRQLRKDPMNLLTRRERILLTSLAQGRTNKELAADLGISVNTVKFHLRNLFEKLSVNNRAQAIAFYYSSTSGRTDRDFDSRRDMVQGLTTGRVRSAVLRRQNSALDKSFNPSFCSPPCVHRTKDRVDRS